MQLQMRLALVLHQAGHLEYSAALNPAQPEAVDAEVRNAAMKAWIAEYAADFRTWLEQRDSHTRVNMDDYQRLLAIVQEIHAIQTERLGTERPPTIH